MYLTELRKFALALRVSLMFETQDGERQEVFGMLAENPVFRDEKLRERLRLAAENQDFPYLYREEFGVYFACIRAADGFYYLGPMSANQLSYSARQRFFHLHSIPDDDVPHLRTFSVQEILYIVELAAQLLTGKTYAETELLVRNKVGDAALPGAAPRGRVHFSMQEETADDDEDSYRHSYRQEVALRSAIRDGDVETALKLNRHMDLDVGKLANTDVGHWRNMAIIGVTLAARAAIDGGLSPRTAYQLSGYYIKLADSCSSSLQLIGLRDKAVRELTERVRDKSEASSTNLIRSAKAYIKKHYREKIYLEDIAARLNVSTWYLSHAFKDETGGTIQSYIVDFRTERAAELLKYSDLSLSDIAAYVNFPSGSYFGKVFRERMGMTPREYRIRHQGEEIGL